MDRLDWCEEVDRQEELNLQRQKQKEQEESKAQNERVTKNMAAAKPTLDAPSKERQDIALVKRGGLIQLPLSIQQETRESRGLRRDGRKEPTARRGRRSRNSESSYRRMPGRGGNGMDRVDMRRPSTPDYTSYLPSKPSVSPYGKLMDNCNVRYSYYSNPDICSENFVNDIPRNLAPTIFTEITEIEAQMGINGPCGSFDERTIDLDRVLRLRKQLEKLYHDAVIADVEYAFRHNLEHCMWKMAFYQPVELLRFLASSSSSQADRCQSLLLHLLEDAPQFYENFINEYEQRYGFFLTDYFRHIDEDLSKPLKPVIKSSVRQVKLALHSSQRFLIALGDLARYREQFNSPSNFGKSRSWYIKAVQLAPHNGRPYNQLALLAVYTVDNCEELMRAEFEYQRLNCKGSFENVERRRRACREIWISPDGVKSSEIQDEVSIPSETELLTKPSTPELFRRCVMYFLYLTGMLYTKIGMEKFETFAVKMLVQFQELLERDDNPTSALSLIQIIMISLFIVHHTSIKEVDNDICFVLQHNAVQLSLSIFGIILKRVKDMLSSDELAQPSKELHLFLPSLHIFCQWMATPATYKLYSSLVSLDGVETERFSLDIWSTFADVCNFLESSRDKGIFKICLQDKNDDGNDEIVLPEDFYCSAFFDVFESMPVTRFVDKDMELEEDDSQDGEKIRVSDLVNDVPLSDDARLLRMYQRSSEAKQAVLESEKCQIELEICPSYVVLDTNAFIYHLALIKKLIEAKKFVVVIPLVVLSELDGLCRSQEDETVASNSRASLNYLYDASDKGTKFLKAITSQGNLLDNFRNSHEMILSKDCNDDKILKCCLTFCDDEKKTEIRNLKVIYVRGGDLQKRMALCRLSLGCARKQQTELSETNCGALSRTMMVSSEVIAPEDSEQHLQVKFLSRGSLVVPQTVFSCPGSADADRLNDLVNKILKDSDECFVEEKFDFLVSGILLRQSLNELVEEHDLSRENTIEIECVRHEPPPVPKYSLPHDDWVGGVWHSGNQCAYIFLSVFMSLHRFSFSIVSGCYDSSVNVWSKVGKHLAKSFEHVSAVKCVAKLHSNDGELRWVTGSNDQTVRVWKYDVINSCIDCLLIGRGHERSVESVGCSYDGTRIASGSFDALLKIWNTDPSDVTTYQEIKDPVKKQRKTDKEAPATKLLKHCWALLHIFLNARHLSFFQTPMVTLSSHREAITGICWSGRNEVITASWDHRIFIWDLEMAGVKDSLAGTKAFTSIDYSDLSNLLISSSADKYVRLWDPRSKEGNLVKCTFSSHKSWVTQVRWNQTNSNLFLSASYDNLLKMWDIRSPKLCLYDLSGHKDRLLCCDWSCKDYVLSGGVDCTVKVYSTEGSKINP
ncbi:unnamed protein product [Soboliphyme baturini]|uniref:Ribosome biogenesis protein WDR12 homolog n=1 Tax=Soboliphyme baturini TaxID=241478 RepID=A0A183IAZ9_9BILA|nr:unnamed protein product [Soboliphyme baturini]